MSWIWALFIVAAVYVAANIIVRRVGPFSSSVTQESLRELICRGEETLRLIDVRTQVEYRAAHIPTAINIPHDAVAARPPKAPTDAVIVVYGRTASQAQAARRTLRRLGFSEVVSFGSVGRWTDELVDGNLPGELAHGSVRPAAELRTSDEPASTGSTSTDTHGRNRR